MWTGDAIVFTNVSIRIVFTCQPDTDMHVYSDRGCHSILTLCGMGGVYKCSDESVSGIVWTRVHESQRLNTVCPSAVLDTVLTTQQSDCFFNDNSNRYIRTDDCMEPGDIAMGG